MPDLHDYKYVHCRAINHSWDESSDRPRRTAYGTAIVLRCGDCPTLRFDVISRATGVLVEREYEYPDDYTIEGGWTREDFRRELLKRLSNGKGH